MYKRPIQAHQIWWCTASIPLPHYFRRAQIPMHLWFWVCIQLLSVFFFICISSTMCHDELSSFASFFFIFASVWSCATFQNIKIDLQLKLFFQFAVVIVERIKKKISTLPTLFEGLDMRLSVDMYAIFATKETKQ